MAVIDATNIIVGRLASFVAKRALLGEAFDIVNCEKAFITGSREATLAKFKRKRSMGTYAKGPHFPRRPHMFVKRIIRGMLPYKIARGRDAFGRIRCHLGIPQELGSKKLETLKFADVSKVKSQKFMTVGEICRQLGARI